MFSTKYKKLAETFASANLNKTAKVYGDLSALELACEQFVAFNSRRNRGLAETFWGARLGTPEGPVRTGLVLAAIRYEGRV